MPMFAKVFFFLTDIEEMVCHEYFWCELSCHLYRGEHRKERCVWSMCGVTCVSAVQRKERCVCDVTCVSAIQRKERCVWSYVWCDLCVSYTEEREMCVWCDLCVSCTEEREMCV